MAASDAVAAFALAHEVALLGKEMPKEKVAILAADTQQKVLKVIETYIEQAKAHELPHLALLLQDLQDDIEGVLES